MAPVGLFSPVVHSFPKKLMLTHSALALNSSCFQTCRLSTAGNQHYDVIIAGGGLVGTAMACALGSSKVLSEKKLLLLEGAPSKPIILKDAYSNRVSAINNSSVQLFQDIKVWDDIKSHRVQDVRKMQIWDASSPSLISFSDEEMSRPIAYIIENDLMQWALTKRLTDIPNCSVRYSAKIKDYVLPKSSSSSEPEIILDSDEKFSCSLLIGADGVNSKVRSKMDTIVQRKDYNQMGVVATLTLSDSTNNIVAWQRFLPDGVIALLPLSESTSSLVWSTSIEKAKSLLSLPEESFVDAVNDAFLKDYPSSPFVDSLLKNLNLAAGQDCQIPPSIKNVQSNSRAAFPLGSTSVSRYVNSCVALIGDAAHRVHPLAGQGVNIGFGDVRCLSHQLENAVYQGFQLGRGPHLKIYQSERLKDTFLKMKAIHYLHSLYHTSFTPIVALRSVGLSLVHSLPFVKRELIKQANL
ncbi:Ubiquinone biosynthesis monooxygenase COQ6, mitochondrial [Frankliniella fusca]|uniref:Ubiquinone biosynthesis monooxygenase COQ6, mitochondrial n=1 Tax=Frankliniella fusca TaxID=407009 RepID=A0AAE1H689_9NEOP|nr:Ubiquinone biosynthesis monooxygenase COQ6, mitochondrial [Frankliniella fusca]